MSNQGANILRRKLNRFFSNLEWRWSLIQLIKGTGLVASFGLPAWAIWAAQIFVDYSPFSWVLAGFCGVFLAALSYALYGYAKSRLMKVRFQARVADTALVNPLDNTFDRKRIRIADLAPPIGEVIRNKTFVECDLIGPANIMFSPDCTFNANSGESVDGLIVREGYSPRNGFGFENCNFSRCRFYLVTFLVPEAVFDRFSFYNWHGLNWLTETPEADLFDQTNQNVASPEELSDNQQQHDTE